MPLLACGADRSGRPRPPPACPRRSRRERIMPVLGGCRARPGAAQNDAAASSQTEHRTGDLCAERPSTYVPFCACRFLRGCGVMARVRCASAIRRSSYHGRLAAPARTRGLLGGVKYQATEGDELSGAGPGKVWLASGGRVVAKRALRREEASSSADRRGAIGPGVCELEGARHLE
jgi:hypothetical protein